MTTDRTGPDSADEATDDGTTDDAVATVADTSKPDAPKPDSPDPDSPAPDEPAAKPPAAVDQTTPQRSRGQVLIEGLTSANTVTVTVLAIVLAFVAGGLLVVLTDEEVLGTFGYFFAQPGDALAAIGQSVGAAYGALLKGAFLDPLTLQEALAGETEWSKVFIPISETLVNAAPLIFTGLAVALAFRAGMFNIGANGQAILGAIVATTVGFALSLPPGLHLVVALLAGMAGGALWGLVPGALKARTGAHEVITTIMLNYIAANLLVYLVTLKGFQQAGRSDAISNRVADSAALPGLPAAFGGDLLRVNLGIGVAFLAAAGVWWLLQRSTVGFEFRAVGANPHASRTAGMSVGRAYSLAMLTAGALAGAGGATVVLGTERALTPNTVGEIGFDGITVALLGRGRPLGVAFAGLLFGALRAGGVRMQTEAGVPVDMVVVLQALIVVFIAAPALVKAIFRLRPARVGAIAPAVAKGW